MNKYSNRWKSLFLFCIGLVTGTAFCMKLMEPHFIYHDAVFTIIGLEISYNKEKVSAILNGINSPVKSILLNHLYFDFAFMAGVYPGITAGCMLVRKKIFNLTFKRILFVLAFLQTAAWVCDILENLYLIKWIKDPVIGNEFQTYHVIVMAKWCIAIFAVLTALFFLVAGKKK